MNISMRFMLKGLMVAAIGIAVVYVVSYAAVTDAPPAESIDPTVSLAAEADSLRKHKGSKADAAGEAYQIRLMVNGEERTASGNVIMVDGAAVTTLPTELNKETTVTGRSVMVDDRVIHSVDATADAFQITIKNVKVTAAAEAASLRANKNARNVSSSSENAPSASAEAASLRAAKASMAGSIQRKPSATQQKIQQSKQQAAAKKAATATKAQVAKKAAAKK